MKARSKAQKRAGRKRRIGIQRQPNGQPARDTNEQHESSRAVAVEARMRQYNMPKHMAETELAGYAIGRMALAGSFGRNYQPSLDAVYDYVCATAEYMRIKCPQHPLPQAMNYLAGRGSSLAPEPSLRAVDRIEARYEHLLKKLALAPAMDRIWFHEAAFHDRLNGERGERAVIVCASLLMAA